MNYREKGQNFCNEINNLLTSNNIKAAFVTGGGYAYDSTKYQRNDNKGDFDFMIIYENPDNLAQIFELLKKSNFQFEDKYLSLDLELLKNNKIDIIRLCGNYLGTKSTINLVPKKLVGRISNFEENLIIKKIAHGRNTSLFFAYGSDNSRIITNFISPSFATDDNQDHYIHLDYSFVKEGSNIYLGILSDAILKGFNENYDSINFKSLRKKFIKNIHSFFIDNNIDSSCFINIFANNQYFPEYLKQNLLSEFNSYGVISGKIEKVKNLNPIIFTIDFDINYPSKPFNFINNKPLKTKFDLYINKMQNNEYDRQYLLDALGKFFGYLLSSNHGIQKYNGSIIDKIQVYGVNDLYLPDYEKYSLESIIKAIINDLKNNSEIYNDILIKNYLIISIRFLEIITKKTLEKILEETGINKEIFNSEIDPEMNINIIKNLNSFNEIGIYHNYSSKVMPKYTANEAKFIESIVNNKQAKVLDIMCGYGRLANALVQNGFEDVTGIDTERYDFLGIPKDFKFISGDFLTHKFRKKYDIAYSLYNCYYDNEELVKNINKTYNILDNKGTLIIDFFNKEWRDTIAPEFYKVLYEDNDYKLIVRRTYDNSTGHETSYYELYHKGIIVKSWMFIQKFFNLSEVTNLIDSSEWNYSLFNSSNLTTRTNEQKNIMVLRKKR